MQEYRTREKGKQSMAQLQGEIQGCDRSYKLEITYCKEGGRGLYYVFPRRDFKFSPHQGRASKKGNPGRTCDGDDVE